jgi:predicted acetyltransferase
VQQYDGAVQRNREQWQLLLEDAALEHTLCFLLEQEGQAEGYCLWTPLKGKILIREMAWCCAEAKAGLLDFLQQSMPAGQRLWLELPDDDALTFQLATAKKAVVRYPFLMARIVDVTRCLEAFTYPKMTLQLVLTVQDAFATWNDGVFLLQLENGCLKVQPATEWVQDEADVQISIDGLSQLVMGARSAAQLQRQGVLQAKPWTVEILQQLWPERQLYINEYY